MYVTNEVLIGAASVPAVTVAVVAAAVSLALSAGTGCFECMLR